MKKHKSFYCAKIKFAHHTCRLVTCENSCRKPRKSRAAKYNTYGIFPVECKMHAAGSLKYSSPTWPRSTCKCISALNIHCALSRDLMSVCTYVYVTEASAAKATTVPGVFDGGGRSGIRASRSRTVNRWQLRRLN